MSHTYCRHAVSGGALRLFFKAPLAPGRAVTRQARVAHGSAAFLPAAVERISQLMSGEVVSEWPFIEKSGDCPRRRRAAVGSRALARDIVASPYSVTPAREDTLPSRPSLPVRPSQGLQPFLMGLCFDSHRTVSCSGPLQVPMSSIRREN